MKIWKNTNTLDGYDKGFVFTTDKSEAEILLLGSKTINLNEFPILKGIFRAGIGKDNIPIDEANKKGIKIRLPSDETINVIYEETASFTCGLIFHMNYSDVGDLKQWKKYDRQQLNYKNLLVIGTGNIGKKVASKMRHFMNVITYDLIDHENKDLCKLISEADFISLHIPNSPDNKSFINSQRLGLMKTGSVLINTARGPIVDEQALFDEIFTRRIKAAFDVFWKEPYDGIICKFHPDYFYMTPHVASTCNGFLQGCEKDLLSFLKEF